MLAGSAIHGRDTREGSAGHGKVLYVAGMQIWECQHAAAPSTGTSSKIDKKSALPIALHAGFHVGAANSLSEVAHASHDTTVTGVTTCTGLALRAMWPITRHCCWPSCSPHAIDQFPNLKVGAMLEVEGAYDGEESARHGKSNSWPHPNFLWFAMCTSSIQGETQTWTAQVDCTRRLLGK